MKNILSDINRMLGITDSYQAPEKIMNILTGDEKECIRVFKEFLNYFKCDISYDWFHEYFEDEHADRKNNKQDFTPKCLSTLVSKLLGSDTGVTYEPTAGTGGMLISKYLRGILYRIFHGDTLRNEYKAVYILTNRFNSPCDFSTITKWK